MYYDYLILAVLLALGVGFVYANMILGGLLRPKKPNELKLSTYECGEEAFGSSWIRFDMRFYSVALIFLLFDLEIAFLFPWAAVFKDPSLGGIVVIEGLIFVGILFLGLVYVWAKGDLDWVRAFSEGRAIMTGQHPADFTEMRRALYEPDAKPEVSSEAATAAASEDKEAAAAGAGAEASESESSES